MDSWMLMLTEHGKRGAVFAQQRRVQRQQLKYTATRGAACLLKDVLGCNLCVVVGQQVVPPVANRHLNNLTLGTKGCNLLGQDDLRGHT
jgi:hypothetical protein